MPGHGLGERLGALVAGEVTPPADAPAWFPGGGVRNAEGVRRFSTDVGERIGASVAAGRFPLVLGGDRGVPRGAAQAMRRRGRFGLLFLGGHLDVRHPGNAARVGAVGEDLVLVTGRGSDR